PSRPPAMPGRSRSRSSRRATGGSATPTRWCASSRSGSSRRYETEIGQFRSHVSMKQPKTTADQRGGAACVIGWPVKHSRSPLIHNYWIKQHGVAGEYRREEVPPDRLADFLARMGAAGYVGCNVTLPHKEAVLALTEPDGRARIVGAANTLWLDGDH